MIKLNQVILACTAFLAAMVGTRCEAGSSTMIASGLTGSQIDQGTSVMITDSDNVTITTTTENDTATISYTPSNGVTGPSSSSATPGSPAKDTFYFDHSSTPGQSNTIEVNVTHDDYQGEGADPCPNNTADSTWTIVIPQVTFGDVVRDGNSSQPDSISPTQTFSAQVTILPASLPHALDIRIDNQGVSGAGSATVSPTSLSASGNVTVTGGTQTDVGDGGGLYLEATLSGLPNEIAGEAINGFTVCAHPTNMVDAYDYPITGDLIGMQVYEEWASDGGGDIGTDLTQCQFMEVVGIEHQDNPPFSPFTLVTNTNYLNCNSDATATDTHDCTAAGVQPTPTGYVSFSQYHVVQCLRCGAVGIVMKNSGFEIKYYMNSNSSTSGTFYVQKYGQNNASSAGTANGSPITSPNFSIPQ